MADIPTQIDYTNKDYEAFRSMMINSIPKLAPQWTDNSELDFGIVVLELLAHGLDILSYYQDRGANEAYLPTAKLRKSVINHGKLVGYTMKNSTPAQFYEVFTLVSPAPSGGFPIYKGTQVSTQPTTTDDPIIFEVDQTTIIPEGKFGNELVNGDYPYKVSVTHGQTISNESLGSSDGQPDLLFSLKYSPVIVDDTLSVFVKNMSGNVQQWSSVSDFLSSAPTDQVYTLAVDDNAKVSVQFGSGNSGAIPDTGVSNITATYRVGGGSIGNVGSTTITNLISPLPGVSSVTNPSVAYVKGTDMESIDSAKTNAPIQNRTSGRIVTYPDFPDAILNQFSEDITNFSSPIMKCVATPGTGGVDAFVYIIKQDLTPLTAAEIQVISNFIDGVRLINVVYQILDGVLVYAPLSITLVIGSTFIQSVVKGTALQMILNFMQTSNFAFGQSLLLSDIIQLLRAVMGVTNVIITTPTTDTTVAANAIIKSLQLSDVTLTVQGGVSA